VFTLFSFALNRFRLPCSGKKGDDDDGMVKSGKDKRKRVEHK
jgi:hypothetical protein